MWNYFQMRKKKWKSSLIINKILIFNDCNKPDDSSGFFLLYTELLDEFYI